MLCPYDVRVSSLSHGRHARGDLRPEAEGANLYFISDSCHPVPWQSSLPIRSVAKDRHAKAAVASAARIREGRGRSARRSHRRGARQCSGGPSRSIRRCSCPDARTSNSATTRTSAAGPNGAMTRAALEALRQNPRHLRNGSRPSASGCRRSSIRRRRSCSAGRRRRKGPMF